MSLFLNPGVFSRDTRRAKDCLIRCARCGLLPDSWNLAVDPDPATTSMLQDDVIALNGDLSCLRVH